jgi:hypothetical protein
MGDPQVPTTLNDWDFRDFMKRALGPLGEPDYAPEGKDKIHPIMKVSGEDGFLD